MAQVPPWTTSKLPGQQDDVAPDGSEIRWLASVPGGSIVHCTLPPGMVSKAVRHRTVDEVWFFLQGHGEVWRRSGDVEEAVPVESGVCLTIPKGTHFQFRAHGREPLTLIITTMPPWPGSQEAVRAKDHWTEGKIP
jgi:mannose-6-phosphate isomerase-like protein (cupin superfamily)